jgi:hypothetical protein
MTPMWLKHVGQNIQNKYVALMVSLSQYLRLGRFSQNNTKNGKWTWNLRSLCTTGSLMTVARELVVHKLHLVGVLVDRSDRHCTEPA